MVEVRGLVEKPAPKDAPSNLSIIGRYVLMPEIFEHLGRMERGAGNEVQLTDGMARLIGSQPFHGLRYEGRRFDCGDKIGFLEARSPSRLKRPDMARRRARLPDRRHLLTRPRETVRRWRSLIASIRPSLREYDIRGMVGGTLSAADAFAIGRVFGSIVAREGGATVAVGYDGRLSSPQLEAALVEGLRASGIEVVHRPRPTPMLYYAATTLKTDGAVMVTGSHNPPDYNGFKMVLGGKPFFGEQIRRWASMALRAATWWTRRGAPERNVDVAGDYVARLLADWDGGDRLLKVVWDNGNGAAGEVLHGWSRRCRASISC